MKCFLAGRNSRTYRELQRGRHAGMHALFHLIPTALSLVVFSSTDEENETQTANKRPKGEGTRWSNLGGLSIWYITLVADVPAHYLAVPELRILKQL